jgi:hypothetical protein
MPEAATRHRRWGRLALAIVLIALAWLGLLPSIGAQANVKHRIETEERLGIDPSAMFYSELKIVPAIAHRVERLNEDHAGAFWTASTKRLPSKADGE